MEIAFKHSAEPPAPPSTHVPGLPAAVDAQVLAFLEKDPANRPQSIVAAVRALEAHAGDAPRRTPSLATAPLLPLETGPTLAPGDVVTQVGKRRLPVVAIVGAAALACIAAAAFLLLGRETTAPPPPAEPVVVAVAAAAPPPPPSEAPPPATEAPAPPTAAPATVAITLAGTPPGTEVLGPGGVVLGAAPGTLRLARGTNPVRIELRAPGYRPLTHELTPLADGTLTLTLEPVARPPVAKKPPPRKPTKDDLEDAFADP
jgi:serine/threonine-protein kinase